jgi:hypothetical protein
MLCMAAPTTLMAQEEDLHKYFDDGGLSARKNIVSTNLLSPISGVVGLRYERAIGKRLAIEVGAYKLIPFYLHEMTKPINFYFSDFEPKGGWGISLSPHVYFFDKAPEYHYMGPRYGFRKHSLQNGATVAVHDLTIDYGYNLLRGENFMFCFDIGLGYRRMIFDGSTATVMSYLPSTETRGTVYSFFSLGIGVMF